MNEMILSTDLKQIELEINHHKNIAGQSIWEIGRRLNHVKENDLAHGEFIKWVEGIGINHPEANRMMRVAKELPNSSTLTNLGSTALYIISTLPEEERTKEHTTEKGEVKTPDEMTVRELQELKKQLKQKDELIESMADSMHDFELHAKELADENEQLKNKPAEVVEKSVVPEDYEHLKESNVMLSKELEKAEYEAQTAREAYDTLLKKRQEEDEGSRKYEELSRAIEEMQGRMSQGQKQIAAQKEVYELVRSVNKLIVETAPLTYLIDTESVLSNEYAQKPIKKIIDSLRDMANRLEENIQTKIIEGEIIND